MKNLKKVYLSLLALGTLFILQSCEKQTLLEVPTEVINNTHTTIEDRASIKITVDFGRRKRNCRGFGICSIEIELELSPFTGGDNGHNSAQMSKSEDGRLIVDFDTQSLSQEENENYFSNGEMFRVDETFVVSDELSQMLGLPSGYTIEVGEYQVSQHFESYRVMF